MRNFIDEIISKSSSFFYKHSTLIGIGLIISLLVYFVVDSNINDKLKIVELLLPSIAIILTLHHFKYQHRLNFYTVYTERYQSLILKFPNKINYKSFEFKDGCSDSEESLRIMHAYFDLCSEQYTLNKEGKIAKDTWITWQAGMKTAFKKTAFQQGWFLVTDEKKGNVKFGSEFEDFIQGLMGDKNPKKTNSKEFSISTLVICISFLGLIVAFLTKDYVELLLGSTKLLNILIIPMSIIGVCAVIAKVLLYFENE